MHVMILGLRGLPQVQGGVETHVEQLAPRLVRNGVTVEVITRSPYCGRARAWNGVRLTRIWSPRTGGVEAFVHTFLGTLYAAVKRPDILHIHAVGPMIMVPLARLLGLKVVVTHHGPDYEREKWGGFAKWLLRTGERVGVKYADACITISRLIKNHVWHTYGRSSVLIRNGVSCRTDVPDSGVLERFGLAGKNYVLQVSRFVPEKRQMDLIQAFSRLGLSDWRLVLAGDIGDSTPYEREVKSCVERGSDVVLTGYQTGEDLATIYHHARLFVLPSSHEGLPIALLEALSYGLPVLASDIGANKEVGLPSDRYFRLGDVGDLAEGIRREAATPPDEAHRAKIRQWIAKEYDWDDIAASTLEVYRSVVPSRVIVQA